MARGRQLPRYEVIDRKGPDHNPVFVIEVTIQGAGSARGEGNSKREAERLAAQDMIENWT